MFYVLTCKGYVYSVEEQITSNKEIKFNHTADIQLQIQCSMMFSSVLTLNRLECLIIFADNKQSMAISIKDQIIYVDINISPYVSSSTQLKSVTGERTENLLILYFNSKNLISSEINLDKSNGQASVLLTPFDAVDKYCLKKHCLATFNNEKTQLNLHNIRSSTSSEPIQFDKECQELCLNESAMYVFILFKSRILFMYRIDNHRQLAKLFIYDFVSFMIADNDFLVLAMNDRRLLTLMIADSDDPTLQARIQALPSR
jgi:hypothetical protein